jgi:hypothetical protein
MDRDKIDEQIDAPHLPTLAPLTVPLLEAKVAQATYPNPPSYKLIYNGLGYASPALSALRCAVDCLRYA